MGTLNRLDSFAQSGSSRIPVRIQPINANDPCQQDIGGQESLRSSWKTYYVNTKAVIMVIDSSDKERLHISKTELHTMMESEASQKA